MQRIRLTFGRDARLKYISHLDLMRLWERAFRRADIPLAYSEGFNPHPKLSTALPLAVGLTSTCELLDVQLEADLPTDALLQRLGAQLPPGIWISSVEDVDLNSSSLSAALRFAEYEVALDTQLPTGKLQDRVASLLAAETLPRVRLKEKQVKRYDLRPLIDDLRLVDDSILPVIWMRLQANPTGSGRPEEVVSAMGHGISLYWIKRVRLGFKPKD